MRQRKSDPAAFRAKALARLSGTPLPVIEQKQRTPEQAAKKAQNDVRNAQRRRGITRWGWKRTKEHFGGKCAYCGVGGKPLHREHFVPVGMHGGLGPDNIVPSCQSCNNRKGQQHPLLWLREQGKLDLYFEITVWLAGQRKR